MKDVIFASMITSSTTQGIDMTGLKSMPHSGIIVTNGIVMTHQAGFIYAFITEID